MKIYINTDLGIKTYHKIIADLLKISEEENDFIQLPPLVKVQDIEKLIQAMESEKKLIFYNYASLEITIKEFKLLYDRLSLEDIKIAFFKEKEGFVNELLEIANQERKVLSGRIKLALQTAKEDGRQIGRPKIDENLQSMIPYLYHKQHYSVRQIAEKYDVSIGTVSKYIKGPIKES